MAWFKALKVDTVHTSIDRLWVAYIVHKFSTLLMHIAFASPIDYSCTQPLQVLSAEIWTSNW